MIWEERETKDVYFNMYILRLKIGNQAYICNMHKPETCKGDLSKTLDAFTCDEVTVTKNSSSKRENSVLIYLSTVPMESQVKIQVSVGPEVPN